MKDMLTDMSERQPDFRVFSIERGKFCMVSIHDSYCTRNCHSRLSLIYGVYKKKVIEL